MDEYISREELRKHLKECYDDKLFDADMKKAVIGIDIYVENMPTADVQPVKHGRWIWVKNFRDCEGDIYSQYKCSCCDFGVGGVYSVEDLTHFCGNCGAIMDGDSE